MKYMKNRKKVGAEVEIEIPDNAECITIEGMFINYLVPTTIRTTVTKEKSGVTTKKTKNTK